MARQTKAFCLHQNGHSAVDRASAPPVWTNVSVGNGCVPSGGCDRGTSCDGRDNDCDGATDEQLDNCEVWMDNVFHGIRNRRVYLEEQTCLAGKWSQCDGVAPTPETDSACDGLDNDCNGTADDGLLNACLTCGALPDEVCDGVDNDCDGLVDEKSQSPCGGCDPPPESCNQQDDDCDGFIDEGVSNACGGCGDTGANRVTASTTTAMGRSTKMSSPPRSRLSRC